MKRAVFLDRDGTINVDTGHLFRVDDFEFIKGAPEAINKIKQAGYLVIVITNQAGIGRGYYTQEDMEKLHNHINDSLKKYGTQIDSFYYCPHHSKHGKGEYKKECGCRKPEPGMLIEAASELKIDLKESFMVGDKLIDIEAGKRAGCKTVLVKTGYGMAELEKANKMKPDYVCEDLVAIADLLNK